MEGKSGKFLVDLLHGFSSRQLFFGLWIIVIGFFVLLMWNYLKKGERRNFRDTPYKPKMPKKSSNLPMEVKDSKKVTKKPKER